MIKKDALEDIGLLDERFFAYYEEVELCARAKQKGYKVAFLSGTKILHKVGRASTSFFKHYLRTRNTLLLYRLHYSNNMYMGYIRVFIRTIKCSVSNLQLFYWSSFVKGIRDYKKKQFYLGTCK
jgi:GT2 family glycosyltransferase